jgi:hypothetical protein
VSCPSPIDSDAYGVPERPIDQEPDPEFFDDQERDDNLDHRHAEEEAVAYDRETW